MALPFHGFRYFRLLASEPRVLSCFSRAIIVIILNDELTSFFMQVV
jgi:hypothetical protein